LTTTNNTGNKTHKRSVFWLGPVPEGKKRQGGLVRILHYQDSHVRSGGELKKEHLLTRKRGYSKNVSNWRCEASKKEEYKTTTTYPSRVKGR